MSWVKYTANYSLQGMSKLVPLVKYVKFDESKELSYYKSMAHDWAVESWEIQEAISQSRNWDYDCVLVDHPPIEWLKEQHEEHMRLSIYHSKRTILMLEELSRVGGFDET